MQNQPATNMSGPGPQYQAPRPKKKITTATILFGAMITLGVVIIGCVIAWIVLLGKVSSDNGKTQLAAYEALEPAAAQPKSRIINSKLGISVKYNQTELSGFGFSDAITYSTNDLDEARPYSVIRIRPIETSEVTRNEITVDPPEMRITTTLQKNFWDIIKRTKEYKDLSSIDALVKQTVSERSSERNTTASDVENKTIGSVEYKKISFTHKDENYAVPIDRREDCYLTVQNDRPFVACINNVRPSNFAVVPQLENVLQELSYSQPDESVLTSDESKDKSMYDGKTDEKVVSAPPQSDTTDDKQSEKTSEQAKIPSYLENSRDFMSVTKALPATVRVGAIYCADITLTFPNSTVGIHLTGACVDKSSTGFFVSREGLVATVGSGVKVTAKEALRAYITGSVDSSQVNDRLSRVLDYLVKSRTLMQTDADALTAGLQERNRDIIDKINSLSNLIASEDITIEREEYKYAIQASDKPIVVNRTDANSLVFAYSDTIYEAELETAEYQGDKSPLQIFNGESEAKDAALLKLKKQSAYPTLVLAASSNVENGGSVNVVGMPMYAFGSLQSGQFRATPLVRQGKAVQTFNGSGNQRLLSIATPSHAGLTGAPVLGGTGEVIGVGTYSEASCPDRNCFASMVVRDTAAISGAAKKRNITLQPTNDISDTWNRAVDEYVRGNYAAALELFNKSGTLYPANYLAPKFAALTKSQLGSATDTSSANAAVSAIKVIILLATILLILLVIARLFMKIFSKPHYETQYGQLAGGQYIDSSQWNKGGGYAGQTPMSSVPQQAAYNPTVAASQPAPLAQPLQQQTQAPYVQAPVQQNTQAQPTNIQEQPVVQASPVQSLPQQQVSQQTLSPQYPPQEQIISSPPVPPVENVSVDDQSARQ
jgi:hypothetical protein